VTNNFNELFDIYSSVTDVIISEKTYTLSFDNNKSSFLVSYDNDYNDDIKPIYWSYNNNKDNIIKNMKIYKKKYKTDTPITLSITNKILFTHTKTYNFKLLLVTYNNNTFGNDTFEVEYVIDI
jgi:hypothetical protein